MPLFTLTIEDYSPFIVYSSGWTPGTSGNDNSTLLYSQSTFMTTTHAGATATIAFNGTGITIFGAKRTNHGFYQVNIDGTNAPAVNGSATPWEFEVPLFDVHGLKQGSHTVQITNESDGYYLDIDYVTIESNIGEDSKGQLYVVNYQDSDRSFSYLPSAAQWSTNPSNLGTFFASSGHSTSSSGASLNFSFNVSDGVSLYGPLSTDGAPYTVSLDGASPATYQSSSDRYLPQALLFHATNLGGGDHHLQLTYQPNGNNEVFAIDYANVYTTNPTNSSASVTGSSSQSGGSDSSKSTTSNSPSSSTLSSSSGLSTGAAAGITMGACIVVLLLGALVYTFLQRRKQKLLEEKRLRRSTIEPYDTNGPRDYYRDMPGRTPVLHIQTNFDSFGAPANNNSPTVDPRRLTLPINFNKSPLSANPNSSGNTWDPRISVAQMSGISPSDMVSPVYRKSRIDTGLGPISEQANRAHISPPGYS